MAAILYTVINQSASYITDILFNCVLVPDT